MNIIIIPEPADLKTKRRRLTTFRLLFFTAGGKMETIRGVNPREIGECVDHWINNLHGNNLYADVCPICHKNPAAKNVARNVLD